MTRNKLRYVIYPKMARTCSVYNAGIEEKASCRHV
jgi:hypothetical protein